MCDVVVVEECFQQCGKVQLRTVVKTSSPSLQQQNSIAWLGTQHQQQTSRLYARAPRLLHSQLLPLESAARRPVALRTPKSVETKASLTGRGGSGHKKIVEKLFEANQKRSVEKLWQKLFSDPSQWWDHRSEKVNARYPDFKHKKTQEALWLNSNLNPPWVEAELASMAPGTVQLNLFAWNMRLAKYAKSGQYDKTVNLFKQMQQEGMIPNRFTFIPVLNACASLQALEEGRWIHTQIIQSGCESDVYLGSSLINMYAKCGSIEDAWRVFNRMPTHDVVVWSAIISGHVKCGQGQKALALYQQMQLEGVEPDPVIFMGVLNACGIVAALEVGRRVHEQIIQTGFMSDILVSSSLINMYAKCGSIEDAWRVFNEMPTRDVVTWSTMIVAHVKYGQGQKALALYQQMKRERVEPDPVTFVAVLNACASIAALEEGRCVEREIIQSGCESHVFVSNALVDMYAKCGSIVDACRVFNRMPTRDVVAWNAMILGHVTCGQGQKALALYKEMQQEGVEPDPITFMGVLNACGSVVALEEGRHVHEQIIQTGFMSNIHICSSLINMYVKCESIENALRVFTKMPIHDVVAWNSIILGNVKCGEGQKAIALYQQMQQEGAEPNHVTFVGVLNACATVLALGEGRHAEEQIIRRGYELNGSLGSSLIDMYAKCGSIEDACRVFNKISTRDVVTWNAMLGGYAMHGFAKEALEHFHRMCEEGVSIDNVTCISILSACSHAGLVDEGLHYFEFMSLVHHISTTVEHYACIIDLLSRAGRLDEAEDLIKIMPCKPTASMWRALLGASQIHHNVEMGERVAKAVLELDPGNSLGSMPLSNINVAAGRWDLGASV
ncbi:unnamed protein product [Sphagnum compactum]